MDSPSRKGRVSAVFTVVCFCALALYVSSPQVAPALSAFEDSAFHKFVKMYGKSYASEAELAHGRQVYTENLARLVQYQAANPDATYGITKFMDVSPEEFLAQYARPITPISLPQKSLEANIPSSWDWRNYMDFPVRDKANCTNADYAFAAAGSVQGLWARQTGLLLDLSPQQILDCSREQGNSGCVAGSIDAAFQYVLDSGGLQPEFSYPFDTMQSTCRMDNYFTQLYVDTVYQCPQNEVDLTQVVLYVPTAVQLSLDPSILQYTGGIITSCSAQSVSVPALLVGYAFSWWSFKYYWILQLSWGEDFGDQGFIYLQRNAQNSGSGICGITDLALFPYFSS